MKELSIEQKAKAYDEAIKRAKVFKEHLLEINDKGYVDEMDYIFPELVESGDEKIRKAIIEFFESEDDNTTYSLVPKKNIIAWLEKQGNIDSHVKLPTFTFDDILALQCCMKIATANEYKELYVQLKSLHDRVYDAYWLEKQGGQKSVTDLRTWKYIADYVVTKWCGIGQYLDSPRLTTIAEELQRKYYLEQKQGEQKPAEWNEDNLPEFESYLCLMFQKFRTKGVCTNGEIIDYVMEHAQKLKDTLCHAWSEEDIMRIDNLIAIIENKGYPDYVEYLEKLKDRVQPQPKQEWSEEDEKMIDAIYSCVDSHYEGLAKTSLLIWLKSLRPRSTWKPSATDIIVLEGVIDGGINPVDYHATLHVVLEQLKKLRGE